MSDGADGLLLSGRFPGDPHEIPESALNELLGRMVQATEEEVFGYIELWESRKGLGPRQTRRLGDTVQSEH